MPSSEGAVFEIQFYFQLLAENDEKAVTRLSRELVLGTTIAGSSRRTIQALFAGSIPF
jgi:hypothetical protein